MRSLDRLLHLQDVKKLHPRSHPVPAQCRGVSQTRAKRIALGTRLLDSTITGFCAGGYLLCYNVCERATVRGSGSAVGLRDAWVQFDCEDRDSRSCSGEEEDYVERICLAIGADESCSSDKEFEVSGTQTLLGMEGNWVLKWQNHHDGRFWERFDGAEMTLEWGYDGRSEPWAVDAAGRCSTLELDDRELHIRLARGDVDKTSSTEFTLSVQLKDSKVVAYVDVDVTTMYPLRAGIKAFGGWSKWQYSDWKPLVAGQRHLFPFSSVLTQDSGNKEVYLVRVWSVEGNKEVGPRELLPSSYCMPIHPIVSRPQKNHPHVDFDSTCLPAVQMLRADSGHFLVQPLVNGKAIGYFIVDTGANSLIIAPQKARELGLTTFGEVHITGVNGVVKSQYCRANTFQLGQLRIINPVFMEISVSGLVRGDPLVVGMCGFDIFAQCIVEMAYDEGRLSLFDPAMYRLLYSESLQWHAMRLLESVPHVSATFNGHTALFMLDSGAGGVDVIFHGRAVEEFDLINSVRSETYAQLMGIDASSKALEVTLGTLDQLTVAGRSFKQVKVMLARKNAGNLESSGYVAGLLCGDLLSKCCIVFDYAQLRFAITTQTEVKLS